MQYFSRSKNQIFFSLVALLSLVGVYVGFITVDRYENIVHGVLGFTLLYLLYFVFKSRKRMITEPREVYLEFPRGLKYLIFCISLNINHVLGRCSGRASAVVFDRHFDIELIDLRIYLL